MGGELTFENRDLAASHESLVTGFGRAAVEVRLPLGNRSRFTPASAAAPGIVDQRVTPHPGVAEPASTTGAFMFGPELALGARLGLGRTLFADLSATGALPFVSQEDALKAVPEVVGALALGARF